MSTITSGQRFAVHYLEKHNYLEVDLPDVNKNGRVDQEDAFATLKASGASGTVISKTATAEKADNEATDARQAKTLRYVLGAPAIALAMLGVFLFSVPYVFALAILSALSVIFALKALTTEDAASSANQAEAALRDEWVIAARKATLATGSEAEVAKLLQKTAPNFDELSLALASISKERGAAFADEVAKSLVFLPEYLRQLPGLDGLSYSCFSVSSIKSLAELEADFVAQTKRDWEGVKDRIAALPLGAQKLLTDFFTVRHDREKLLANIDQGACIRTLLTYNRDTATFVGAIERMKRTEGEGVAIREIKVMRDEGRLAGVLPAVYNPRKREFASLTDIRSRSDWKRLFEQEAAADRKELEKVLSVVTDRELKEMLKADFAAAHDIESQTHAVNLQEVADKVEIGLRLKVDAELEPFSRQLSPHAFNELVVREYARIHLDVVARLAATKD